MAGQSDAKPQQQPPGAGGPWGAAGVFSHRFGRPRARNPLWRAIAPPYSAPAVLRYLTVYDWENQRIGFS
eukprot:7392700-Heterocapsa_arctica.AAC.1